MKPCTWFDNEFTGRRWTYGLNYRPLAQYNVPEGWIIFSNRADNRFAFGTVQYPFRLPDSDVSSFELTPTERNA